MRMLLDFLGVSMRINKQYAKLYLTWVKGRELKAEPPLVYLKSCYNLQGFCDCQSSFHNYKTPPPYKLKVSPIHYQVATNINYGFIIAFSLHFHGLIFTHSFFSSYANATPVPW